MNDRPTSNEERQMLAEVANDFFKREWNVERAREAEAAAANGSGVDQQLWTAVARNGWPAITVPEDLGGDGAGLTELAVIVEAAAHACAPAPIAETAGLAAWLVGTVGQSLDANATATVGPVIASEAAALSLNGDSDRQTLSGSVSCIPWGQAADVFVGLVSPGADGTAPDGGAAATVVAVELNGRSGVTVEPGFNLAGEPRDRLTFDGVPVMYATVAPQGVTLDLLLQRAAALRAVAITGALDRALQLSIQYAQEREQFGRPIAKFQVIQHYLAEIAGEVAGAKAAVAGALAAESTDAFADEAAAAKVWTGRAAGIVARLAHQIHGAIGVTDEHELNLTTRRLWSWRDEFGSEREWSSKLAAGRSGADIWETVVN